MRLVDMVMVVVCMYAMHREMVYGLGFRCSRET